MVPGARDTGGAKNNRILLVSFVGFLDTPEFSFSFNSVSLHVKHFLCWFHAGTVALTGAIEAVLTEKSQCRAT